MGNDLGVLLFVACGEKRRKHFPRGASDQVRAVRDARPAQEGVVGEEVAAVTVLDAEQDVVESLEKLLHGFDSRCDGEQATVGESERADTGGASVFVFFRHGRLRKRQRQT